MLEENENINKNIFDLPEFEDLISKKMDFIDELQNRLPETIDKNNLTYVDKKFFKRVFKDITDIEIAGETLIVEFGRGVNMYIYSDKSRESLTNRDTNYYKTLLVLGELLNLKEMNLKTSPFIVKLNSKSLNVEYFKSLDQKLFDKDIAKNIHDDGINCWGGWGGLVLSNFNELNLEESLMFIIQRMQQLNIDDYAGTELKMGKLVKNSYYGQPISLDPIVLAKLLVIYDIKYYELNGNKFFGENISFSEKDNKLYIFGTKTDIDFDIFKSIVTDIRKI